MGEGHRDMRINTGFYYPDRSNLSRNQSPTGFKSVDACRTWIEAEARRHHDVRITRGYYDCSVGFLKYFGDMKIYRIITC